MPDDIENEPRPRPLPADAITTPEEAMVHHAIRGAIWGPGRLDHSEVDVQLRRDLVEKFVALELEGLPGTRYWKVRVLADMYNLTGLLPHFQAQLAGHELDAGELRRSIACTMILEEIGGEDRGRFAAQYYSHLVAHSGANECLEELVECLGVLGDRAPAAPLLRRFEQEIRRLEDEERRNGAAGIEKRALEEVRDNEFPVIEAADAARRRVRVLPTDDLRLYEWIRIYLGLTEDGGAEYLDQWTQRMIRRAADSRGPALVIAAFLDMAEQAAALPESDRIFCQIRCFNAIRFFGGELEPSEAAVWKKHRRNQQDPLSRTPAHGLHEAFDEIEEAEEEQYDEE